HPHEVLDELVLPVKHLDTPQPQPREADSENAPAETDHTRLDDVLGKNRVTGCTERASQADVPGAPHDLCEQQADRIQQAHDQEQDGQPKEHLDVVCHHFLVRHPLHHVVQPVVQGPREPSHGFLRFNIRIEESHVVLLLLLAVQFYPHLHPDTFGVEEGVPPVIAPRLPAICVPAAIYLVCDAHAEGEVQLLHLVESLGGNVIKPRHQIPVVQHADDAEHFAVHH